MLDTIVGVGFGFYGYRKTDKGSVVAATTFIGSLIVAFSIYKYAEGKIGVGANDGVQASCIVVLGYSGHVVQMRVFKREKSEEITVAATNGDFLEY